MRSMPSWIVHTVSLFETESCGGRVMQDICGNRDEG